jgi:hypothetical protein
MCVRRPILHSAGRCYKVRVNVVRRENAWLGSRRLVEDSDAHAQAGLTLALNG